MSATAGLGDRNDCSARDILQRIPFSEHGFLMRDYLIAALRYAGRRINPEYRFQIS
jgi:hypothetical protein